jgi:VanZ family protein
VAAWLRAIGRRLVAAPRAVAWTLALAWYALIAWLSSQPGSPEPAPAVWAWLWNLGHAPLFGVQALTLALLVRRAAGWPDLSPAAFALLIAAVAALGIADELHQHYLTPGRDGSVGDLAIDVTGAASTLAVIRYLGSPRADERGLWRRLGLGLAACAVVAAIATFALAAR